MAGDRWHHVRGLVVGSCEPLGLLIANLSGWKPDAGVSGWVNGPLTSLAIVELLLAVELRRVLLDARRLLPPFLASVLATVFAVLVFGWVIRPWLSEDASALAAVYTATFTGGTLNFVSVGRSLAIPDDLFAIATSADYVVFTGWFLLSLLIGRERQASGVDSIARNAHTSDAQMADGPRALGIAHQPKSLASVLLGGGCCHADCGTGVDPVARVGVGCAGDHRAHHGGLADGTTANRWFPSHLLRHGTGLDSTVFRSDWIEHNAWWPVRLGLPVLVYAFLMVGIQALAVWLVRCQQRWALVDSLVASQAAVGGPSIALALASSLGRSSLVLPAVAVGLLEMLIGTYLGLAVETLFQWPVS